MKIFNVLRTVAGCSVLAGLLLLPLIAGAQTNSGGVQSADLKARLTAEGTLQIEETIRYDFGNQQSSGFTRRLQVPAKGSIDIDAVRRDDLSENYRSTRAGNIRRVITGDSDIPLTGEHTYEFIYTVDGAVTFTDSGPQISWQAISGSEVAADDITITLTSTAFEISQASCRLQETDRGCPVTRVDQGVQAQLTELPANRSVLLRADLPSSALTLQDGDQKGQSTTFYLVAIVVLLVLAGSSYGVYHYLASKSSTNSESEPVPDHIDTLSSS